MKQPPSLIPISAHSTTVFYVRVGYGSGQTLCTRNGCVRDTLPWSRLFSPSAGQLLLFFWDLWLIIWTSGEPFFAKHWEDTTLLLVLLGRLNTNGQNLSRFLCGCLVRNARLCIVLMHCIVAGNQSSCSAVFPVSESCWVTKKRVHVWCACLSWGCIAELPNFGDCGAVTDHMIAHISWGKGFEASTYFLMNVIAPTPCAFGLAERHRPDSRKLHMTI